jgi:Leucine-rich repeat (LRR) protein
LVVLIQPYTGLRTLYLESNAISTIESLDCLPNLRCLYLGKNLISSLQGLQQLTQLEVLDVSHNRILNCCGLRSLVSLRSLNLSNNRLSTAADLAQLPACTRLVTLDLSDNKLSGDGVLDLLAGAQWLLLRLQGNPLVGHTE